MYEYQCLVEKIVDGDTVDVKIDLGFDVSVNARLRLSGINAPEMNTEAGKAAKARLAELIPVSSVCKIKTFKDRKEKYGRYLANMQTAQNNQWVCETLVKEGHAVLKDY